MRENALRTAALIEVVVDQCDAQKLLRAAAR
jgi:hypothetical protein